MSETTTRTTTATIQDVAPVLLGFLVSAPSPKGIPQKELLESLKKTPCAPTVEVISSTVNMLLKKNQIAISKVGDTLYFKVVASEEREKFKGLSAEDRLIYQLIESSKDKGIWIRDLRIRSNLQQTQISKILRTLELRKLVKSVKSVVAKNRRVFMLYDMEPSREVTGGAWYNEQDFDEDFIKVLYSQCLAFITEKSYASIEEVHDYIRNCGIFKVELRPEDIKSILDTLVFDGVAEEMRDLRSLSGRVLFKPCRAKLPENPFTTVPCSKCPVFQLCSNGSANMITPAKCPYLKTWLAS